jgi:hypothetical protein
MTAGSTCRGGILGRRKRVPTRSVLNPSISAALKKVGSRGTPAGERKAVEWSTMPPASSRTSVRLRYERLMAMSVVDRTAPALLDVADVCGILDLTPGQVDRRVRDGVLEDMVCAGDRQLFRAADVRALLLDERAA